MGLGASFLGPCGVRLLGQRVSYPAVKDVCIARPQVLWIPAPRKGKPQLYHSGNKRGGGRGRHPLLKRKEGNSWPIEKQRTLLLLETIGSQTDQVSPDTPNPFLTSDLVPEVFLETGL